MFTLFLRREIFMRQGILLAHFLCDRVQGVERFPTQPRHFPNQIPPRFYNSTFTITHTLKTLKMSCKGTGMSYIIHGVFVTQGPLQERCNRMGTKIPHSTIVSDLNVVLK